MDLLQTLRRDIDASFPDGPRPGRLHVVARLALTVKLQCVVLFRLSHAAGRGCRWPVRS